MSDRSAHDEPGRPAALHPEPAGTAALASVLDASLVRAWARIGARSLGDARAVLDRVNVFPVADADTGTNLYLTFREGERAVSVAPAHTGGPALLGVLARGALLGAQGNSGVILSEWLRGLAVAAARGDGPVELLERAASSARSAVARPVEGTILTAADAAAAGATGYEVLPAMRAAAGAARASALESRDRLGVLREAGVLDAGALGLVLVLDALVAAIAGGRSDGAAPGSGTAVDLLAGVPTSGGEAACVDAEHADAGQVELMFVVTRAPGQDARDAQDVSALLRAALAEVGDSVVVTGGETGDGAAAWQAHVHTDRLEQALAVAVAVAPEGALAQVRVRQLRAADQHEWGVVVASSAPALAAELARTGATVLLVGGLGRAVEPVTTADVDRAAASTGAARVLFLGAELTSDVDGVVAVAAPTDVHVVVALAALALVHAAPDQVRPAGPQETVGRALAVLACRSARAADVVGVLGEVAGPDATVVTALLDADVPADLPDRLAEALAGRAPDAELVVRATGRPGDGVHLGVEPGVGHGIEGDA